MTALLEQLAASLQSHKATRFHDPANSTAAVAMILRQKNTTLDILFIKRASHVSDPWSGHIAFPGGRMDPDDPTLQQVAERETHEELNIDLSSGKFLGRLDDQHGRRMTGAPRMSVSCFVYADPDIGQCKPNYEVDACFWVPLDHLTQPKQLTHLTFQEQSYAGIELPPYGTLWGLTYRFLENFLAIISYNNSTNPAGYSRQTDTYD